jgi:hypothetical protein
MSKITQLPFFLALLFMALSISVIAQPNYSLYEFRIQKGEGENYYEREAKRNFEPDGGVLEKTEVPDRFRASVGLINAATGLKIAKRKGSISDLQTLLRDNYDWITEANLVEIEDLEAQSADFVDDQTVYMKAEIVNYYTVINKYNKVLKTTPPAKFEGAKKKDPNLELDMVDVSDKLVAAKEAFETAKQSAAAMHFDKGRELARGQDMESNKEAAKRYRYALEYVGDFRDAKTRYEAARKLGTTRLGISTFESFASADYGDLGAQISNDILSRFSMNKDEFEFFEVIDRDALDRILEEQKLSLSGLMDESTTAELGGLAGVNSIIIGKVTQANVDRQRLDPVTREYEKEVKTGEEKYTDDDGKEKTRDIKAKVKVYMNEHKKLSNATVSASYKILDVATGAVLAADNLTYTSEWEGEWYTYRSGDKRAIPRRLGRTEVPYISEVELARDALNKVTSQINGRIAQYAREVSE